MQIRDYERERKNMWTDEDARRQHLVGPQHRIGFARPDQPLWLREH